MKKLLILFLVINFSSAFLGGGDKIVCYCAGKASCVNVIANLLVAERVIKLNYRMFDRMMSAQMDKIHQNEKNIQEKQKTILKLTQEIRKIQTAIAFEERKKSFYLNKLKELNVYKE